MALSIARKHESSSADLSLDGFLEKLHGDLNTEAAVRSLTDALDSMVYKGFDAKRTRDLAIGTFEPEGILRLCTVGALRGSAAVSLQAKSGGDPTLHAMTIKTKAGVKTILQLYSGRILYAEKNSSKVTGKQYIAKACSSSDHLTVQRLVAAFPDMAAYGLSLLEDRGLLSKRVDTKLPAWLIFPAAASLPLNSTHEQILKDMCQKFSVLIGGNFDESIYKLQRSNLVPISDNVVHQYLVDRAADNPNYPIILDQATE
jgi:hypothetical protein